MPSAPGSRTASSWWVVAAAAVAFGIALPSPALAHEPRAAVVVRHDPPQFVFQMKGHRSRARLGIGVVEMTPELRRFFGAPEDVGILVGRVEDESAAKRGGVKVGDVIVEVAGKEIGDAGDVQRALAERDEGEKVTVVLLRKKKKLKKKIAVKSDKDESAAWVMPPMPPDVPDVPDVPMVVVPGDNTRALEAELEATRAAIRAIEQRLGKLEQKRRKATNAD